MPRWIPEEGRDWAAKRKCRCGHKDSIFRFVGYCQSQPLDNSAEGLMIIMEKIVHAISFENINIQVDWLGLRFGMDLWKKQGSDGQDPHPKQSCRSEKQTLQVFIIANMVRKRSYGKTIHTIHVQESKVGSRKEEMPASVKLHSGQEVNVVER